MPCPHGSAGVPRGAAVVQRTVPSRRLTCWRAPPRCPLNAHSLSGNRQDGREWRLTLSLQEEEEEEEEESLFKANAVNEEDPERGGGGGGGGRFIQSKGGGGGM